VANELPVNAQGGGLPKVRRFWLNLIAGNWTIHREGCRHYGRGPGRWTKDAPPFMAVCWLCLRDVETLTPRPVAYQTTTPD
jgi:hypothetical protein